MLAATLAGACMDEPDRPEGEATADQNAAATPAETKLCFPTAGRKVPVSGPGRLQALLDGADPGDHLVLVGGTYNADYTYDRDGREAAPIVIRAAPGETVTFRGTLRLGGSFTVLTGVQVTGGGRILLTGHHNRITQIKFFGIDAGDGGIIETDGNAIAFNRIDHNEFRNFTGAAYRSDGFGTVDDNQGIRLDHNYFFRHSVGPNNESVLLMLTDAYNDSHLSFDSNLFEDVLNGNRGESELVSIKTGASSFSRNTVKDSPNVKISLRQTNRSRVEDNVLTGGASIRVYGDDNVVSGNRVTGGAIEVRSGDGTMADRPAACDKNAPTTPPSSGCRGLHPAARGTMVSNNFGPIVVGDGFDGDRVDTERTTLRNNDQKATRGPDERTTGESGIGRATSTARALDTSDVGVDAPDPSCR